METLQRTANRGSISTGYDIDNSLKLEPDNSEFLSITNTSAGNRRTATYSFWLKRTELDASSYMQVAGLFTSSETTRFMFYQDHIMLENGNGGTRKRLTTNAVYRDTSAFYHFVVAIDTTQSTAANRVKLYVNGVQETSFSTEEYPDQNFDLSIGQSGANFPWRYGAYDATYYKTAGYLAEAHYIDGTQYAASDFGEFDEDSGIWKPKEFTGTYGTQGSYLNFSDASNLGANSKGSDIDAVLNNITAADQATDTPTNNFCTLNVISAIGDNTYTEGATKGIANAQNEQAEGTFMINKGKWYFEAQNITSTGAMFGFGKPNNWATGNPNNPGNDTSSFALANDGNVYYNSNTAASGWSTNATTDKVMIAIDLDNGFCYFGKNGTWGNSGDPTSGATGTGGFNYVSLVTNISLGDELVPALRISYTQTHGAMFNFGGYTVMSISSAASDANGYGTFEYAPPSGYYALCTKNLAEYG